MCKRITDGMKDNRGAYRVAMLSLHDLAITNFTYVSKRIAFVSSCH